MRPVGAGLIHADGQMDGQMDTHDEANGRFLLFFKQAHKNPVSKLSLCSYLTCAKRAVRYKPSKAFY
jgi:hypothetical protein